MIEFQKAVKIAEFNASELLPNATNFTLEGLLLSEDGKLVEVSLSYDIQGRSGIDMLSTANKKQNTNLSALATILGFRREYKVFLVDANSGVFRGFKNYKRD